MVNKPQNMFLTMLSILLSYCVPMIRWTVTKFGMYTAQTFPFEQR